MLKQFSDPLFFPIKQALVSVFNKEHLIFLGQALQDCQVHILASGGSAKALLAAHIQSTSIETYTAAPELLGGRVKTLHPHIHAGILADRRNPKHQQELQTHGYQPIDLVVCNLYPFAEVLAGTQDKQTLIEHIDIGGPTLLRAAAKNSDGGVVVLCDPQDYQEVVTCLKTYGGVPQEIRQRLAAKAFAHVAAYDALIASWMAGQQPKATKLPQALSDFVQTKSLRYGENPHQQAALYTAQDDLGLAQGTLLHGKPLSYNNYLDMDAAYRVVSLLKTHGCAIVKHTNPCGLAEDLKQATAFQKALAGDKTAAFGGILGFNSVVELACVQAIDAAKLFVECIVAPDFSAEALVALQKRENLRLFKAPPLTPNHNFSGWSAHRISGGLLVQQTDVPQPNTNGWQVVSQQPLAAGWLEELKFANLAAMALKSNAIAIVNNHQLLGAGAGQMSRIDAARQALYKAGKQAKGAFMASDAFFPFADCVNLAAEAGIVAIVQPGGSKRDQESIDACNAHNISMVMTGQRHFRH